MYITLSIVCDTFGHIYSVNIWCTTITLYNYYDINTISTVTLLSSYTQGKTSVHIRSAQFHVFVLLHRLVCSLVAPVTISDPISSSSMPSVNMFVCVNTLLHLVLSRNVFDEADDNRAGKPIHKWCLQVSAWCQTRSVNDIMVGVWHHPLIRGPLEALNGSFFKKWENSGTSSFLFVYL